MTALSKFKLVLLAATALMVSGSISNAQTSSERSPGEKSAIAKPVADPSCEGRSRHGEGAGRPEPTRDEAH